MYTCCFRRRRNHTHTKNKENRKWYYIEFLVAGCGCGRLFFLFYFLYFCAARIVRRNERGWDIPHREIFSRSLLLLLNLIYLSLYRHSTALKYVWFNSLNYCYWWLDVWNSLEKSLILFRFSYNKSNGQCPNIQHNRNEKVIDALLDEMTAMFDWTRWAFMRCKGFWTLFPNVLNTSSLSRWLRIICRPIL